MGKLNDLSITIGKDNKAELVFDSLFPDFLKVDYSKPNEYIQKYWDKYSQHPVQGILSLFCHSLCTS